MAERCVERGGVSVSRYSARVPDNPFSTTTAARLYAEGRPDYSSIVAEVIGRLTGIEVPVALAVDVGCGTGLSTMALAPLAVSVIGLDPSVAMLRRAQEVPNARFVVGAAEQLPIGDRRCDLVAAGSAFHWFDQRRFLREAIRVASPGGRLVLSNHWFSGEMENEPGFARWSSDRYSVSYPPPARDRSWQPPADLPGWRHVGWERYDHKVVLSVDQLASYLLSQSNLQVIVARGDQSEDELRDWLRGETEPFFHGEADATFSFGGFVAVHEQPGEARAEPNLA